MATTGPSIDSEFYRDRSLDFEDVGDLDEKVCLPVVPGGFERRLLRFVVPPCPPVPKNRRAQEPPLGATALFLTLLFFVCTEMGFHGCGGCRATILAGRTNFF